MKKNNIPKDLTLAITYRCNLRCGMCNIWSIEKPKDLPLKSVGNLSGSLRHINLSGGEPFLHPELVKIVRVLKETSPKAEIIISTNGFATRLIKKRVKEILKINPKIGIRVSIDGIRKTHDNIRGVTGSYSRAMEALRELKGLGVRNLGIGFTLMDKNAKEAKKVYDLSRRMKLQFAIGLVQNSESYFKKTDNAIKGKKKTVESLDYVIDQELKSMSPKRWLRAYFSFGLKTHFLHKKNILPWRAGIDSLFIDPGGSVYPNHLIDAKLGNITMEKLDRFWDSPRAKKARLAIEKGEYEEKWVMCAVRQAMKKHWRRVGWWVIKNKLKRIV